MATAQNLLEVASSEVGYSRWSDPEEGTKYGRWYASKVGDPYFGCSGVPYCAMFCSWCLDIVSTPCAGFIGAYCPSMLNAAVRENKALVDKHDARPGDVVYFDWDGGVVDHVGFVEKNLGGYIQTIEGNTNNGQVCRRTRSWESVRAVVRPDYDGQNVSPAPSDTSSPSDDEIRRLANDVIAGKYGNGEDRRQRLGGRYDAVQEMVNVIVGNIAGSAGSSASSSPGYDQWVSDLQDECNRQGFSNQTRDGIPGPNTIAGCPVLRKGARGNITKLMQLRLIARGYSCGASGADGIFGDDTREAVKRFQAANGLSRDGVVGPNTWAKLVY